MHDRPRCSERTVLEKLQFGVLGDAHRVDPRFFALRLSHDRNGPPTWEPGQFVMVRPASFGLEIPWGRPLGICTVDERALTVFFQVIGRGTQKLAAVQTGENVLVWGPLGNGFAIETEKPTVLLAGGMGIVPFIGYVRRHPAPWKLMMVFGHTQPIDCYPINSVRDRIPVDSLRETKPGDLDNLLFTIEERMRDCGLQNGLVLACGPLPFLRTVHHFAKAYQVRTQLSLENRMACGVGACLGCVTKKAHSNDNLQICTKGPIFWADQIDL
ncbi:MAG: dihydroorotate dehydrogenase electron transfer subunit [Desulfovibrionaceae bacterium]|nr:dihydroorotate dehydrogenase electron transfer subunit [Desulfovibrionaceae bacterium]